MTMTSILKNRTLWVAGMSLVVPAFVAVTHLDLLQTTPASATEQAAAPPAVPVTVETVQPRTVAIWQEFSGRLESVERVQLRSRVAGAIQSVHFREGGLVKAGDLLVTIDPASFEAVRAQAAGQVASASARLDLALAELERGKALSASRTISQSDYAQRLSTHAQAVADLQSAQAQLAAAQIDLDHTKIRAPVSGRAGRLELTVGNLVAAGAASPVLTTIVSVDPIYASFSVGEEMIGRTLAALPVVNGVASLDAVPVEIRTAQAPDAPLRGKLQLIDNEVDQASGTVRVRAVFDNPDGRLLPGQFVRIRLGEPKSEPRLAVSELAIGTDQDKKFVFLVDQANVATYREVKLGVGVDGGRLVEAGLSAGDRIVVSGLQRLRPGAHVAPQEKAELAKQ
jgi:membrane fusion protein, multidrug efflux system